MTDRKFYCFAVRIKVSDLPAATALMNESSEWFRSRVSSITIQPDKEEAIVIVEHTNDYPFMTNRWEIYRV
jgi:hypothetical protein